MYEPKKSHAEAQRCREAGCNEARKSCILELNSLISRHAENNLSRRAAPKVCKATDETQIKHGLIWFHPYQAVFHPCLLSLP
jgi:hypothetical protein